MNIKRIYFYSTSSVTGGPENIQQACKSFNDNGIESYIIYDNKCLKHNDRYLKYNNKIASNIIDDDNSLVVFYEGSPLVWKMPKICNYHKAIFWLSVDNYLKYFNCLDLKQRLQDFNVEYNFCQSFYSKQFLELFNAKNIVMIGDYISDAYFKNIDLIQKEQKKKQILVNPKKNFDRIQILKSIYPDLNIIKIENMNEQQIINLMDESMLYIDFGKFPGKDRLIREACLRHCICISGLDGAACNDVDISIPNELKIIWNYSNISKIYKKL